MGLRLNQSGTYKWPVTVQIPIDGGKYEKTKFEAEFKRLTETRILEINELITKGKIVAVDLCKEVLVGWEGIEDDDGNEEAFSEANKKKLLNVPRVAQFISEAFYSSIEGAKRKN